MSWTTERFEAAAARSQALHGNKHTLPVAVAVAELGHPVVQASEVGVQLEGRIPPHRILEALVRLCAVGALEELPHPGRPHPRVFERRANAYWNFVAELAPELDRAGSRR